MPSARRGAQRASTHGLMSLGSWGGRAGQAQEITAPALPPSPMPCVTHCPLTEPEDPPGLTTQYRGAELGFRPFTEREVTPEPQFIHIDQNEVLPVFIPECSLSPACSCVASGEFPDLSEPVSAVPGIAVSVRTEQTPEV